MVVAARFKEEHGLGRRKGVADLKFCGMAEVLGTSAQIDGWLVGSDEWDIGHGEAGRVRVTAESCPIAASALPRALARLRLIGSITRSLPHLVRLASFPSDLAGKVDCA